MANKVLIYLLKELKLTQGECAKICGTNIRTINNWVNGRTRTPAIILIHLKLLLDIKIFQNEAIQFSEVKDAK